MIFLRDLVTGLEAGGLIAVPGECRFSLIGKLLPGDSLDRATAEIEAVIRAATPADIGIEIAFPAGRDHPRGGSPAGIAVDHDLVIALCKAARLAALAAKPAFAWMCGSLRPPIKI